MKLKEHTVKVKSRKLSNNRLANNLAIIYYSLLVGYKAK
jgi:hypothetical protein